MNIFWQRTEAVTQKWDSFVILEGFSDWLLLFGKSFIDFYIYKFKQKEKEPSWLMASP